MEETLKTWSTTIYNPEVEEIFITDPKMKDLELQWETPLRALEHRSPSSSLSPNPSLISPTDYFHLREAVYETIQVLQKTKSAFRSKELAALRQKLESLLAQTKEPLTDSASSTD